MKTLYKRAEKSFIENEGTWFQYGVFVAGVVWFTAHWAATHSHLFG